MNYQRYLFLTVLLLSCLNVNALDVDVFPMIHPSKKYSQITAEYEMVMKSQHALMMYLNENNYPAVFLESSYENLLSQEVFNENNPNGIEALALKASAGLSFDNDKFPTVYEDMTPVQKIILDDQGDAVRLMFLLGKVKAIMATCTQEQFSNWVLKNVNNPELEQLYAIAIGFKAAKNPEELARAKRLYEEVTTNREIVALNFIEEYRKKTRT